MEHENAKIRSIEILCPYCSSVKRYRPEEFRLELDCFYGKAFIFVACAGDGCGVGLKAEVESRYPLEKEVECSKDSDTVPR